jgi:chemotaxis protein methyltransferase CheR
MMDTQLNPRDVDEFVEAVYECTGFDARHYARPALTRRIRRHLQFEGVESVSSLCERVLADPQSLECWILALSSHKRSMFRQPGFYQRLRTAVVPYLRTFPSVKIWHIGCGLGAETYGLAVTLQEEGLYNRCHIYATDACEVALARARRGIYPRDDIEAERGRYIEGGGYANLAAYYHEEGRTCRFRRELGERITFAHHNLATDGPFNEFQLIVCRDVLIDFNAILESHVFTLIHESLCRLGVLGIGEAQSLRLHPHQADYQRIASDQKLYRRTR